MRIRILIFCICLSGTSLSQEFLNLDFEYEIYGSTTPKKWYCSCPGYIAELDETEKHSLAKSLRMASNSPKENSFGAFTGYFPVELVKGKSIEFKGYLKTESITQGYAGLWWKVTGPNGDLAFDNMEDTGLQGSNDWQEVSLKLNIDENATEIEFGGLLSGKGTAWFDNFQIHIDGQEFKDIQPRSTALTEEEKEWLKKNVYPLSSYDPNTKSSGDLEILDALIGDAQVVGLGEVTHGSSEIFKMKHRIIKFLAENKDFDIFSMEANMPEAYKINNYIIDGKGNPKDLIKGMHFWTWNTQEVLDMVEWMKLYNVSGQKIKFTGFDMQYYDQSIKELEKNFRNNDAVLNILTALKQILNKTSQQHLGSRMGAISKEDKFIAKEKLNLIGQALKNLNLSKKKRSWLHQNIRIIEQYIDKTVFTRGPFMAENLMWIRSQKKKAKIAIWAHNAHIQRTMYGMGNVLSDSLAKDYVSIGFAFHKGSYTAIGNNGLTSYQAQESYTGTFENFFNTINVPIFIIDLRSVKAQKSVHAQWLLEKLDFRQVGQMKTPNEFYETDLKEDYDLIIFINNSSGSKIID
ncbi:erythromycin esterase family protein [Spongiimicrobium salis]|uniref:erythromycin esterase family protein n=1 Tax=Spongiimicrobium salis TaxID=1667022 RepID=UPI00374DA61D